MASTSKCMFCEKTFFDNSTRNRHLKRIHNKEQQLQQQHQSNSRANVFCSLCPKEEKVSFASYALLTRHLVGRHNIEVKEKSMKFTTTEDFENWMTLERLDTKYVLQRTSQMTEHAVELDLKTRMKIRLEELANVQHNEVDAESIRDSMKKFLEETKKYVGVTEKKRKLEKQSYYPNKNL